MFTITFLTFFQYLFDFKNVKSLSQSLCSFNTALRKHQSGLSEYNCMKDNFHDLPAEVLDNHEFSERKLIKSKPSLVDIILLFFVRMLCCL